MAFPDRGRDFFIPSRWGGEGRYGWCCYNHIAPKRSLRLDILGLADVDHPCQPARRDANQDAPVLPRAVARSAEVLEPLLSYGHRWLKTC